MVPWPLTLLLEDSLKSPTIAPELRSARLIFGKTHNLRAEKDLVRLDYGPKELKGINQLVNHSEQSLILIDWF